MHVLGRRNRDLLKISSVTRAGLICLRLDGSLSGRWIAELRRLLEHAFAQSGAVSLDLERVRYVDLEGVSLLRAFSRRNLILLNCSAFVAEQLKDVES